MPLTAATTGFHMSFCFGLMIAPGSLYMKRGRELPGLVGVQGRLMPEISLFDGLVPVDAGAEGLLAGAGQDDHADVVIPPQRRPEPLQFSLHP